MDRIWLFLRRWWFSAVFWSVLVLPALIEWFSKDDRGWLGLLGPIAAPGSALLNAYFKGAFSRDVRLPGGRTLEVLSAILPVLDEHRERLKRNNETAAANGVLRGKMQLALAPYDLHAPVVLDASRRDPPDEDSGEVPTLTVRVCAEQVASELLHVMQALLPRAKVDVTLFATTLELVYYERHGPAQATALPQDQRNELIEVLAALALRHDRLREETSGRRHNAAAISTVLRRETRFNIQNLTADLREKPMTVAQHMQFVLHQYKLGTLPDHDLDDFAAAVGGHAREDLPRAAAERARGQSYTQASLELLELLYRHKARRVTERVWIMNRDSTPAGSGLAVELATALAACPKLLPYTARHFTADELAGVLVQLDDFDLTLVGRILVRLDTACSLLGAFGAFLKYNAFPVIVSRDALYEAAAGSAVGQVATDEDAYLHALLGLLHDHAERWVASAPITAPDGAVDAPRRALAVMAVGRFLAGHAGADARLRALWSQQAALDGAAEILVQMLVACFWQSQGGSQARAQVVPLSDLALHWAEWHAAVRAARGDDAIEHVQSLLLEQMQQGHWPHTWPADDRESARLHAQLTGALEQFQASADHLRAGLALPDRQRLDAFLTHSDALARMVTRAGALAPVATGRADAQAPQRYLLTFGSAAGPLAKLVDCLATPSDAQRAHLEAKGVELEVPGPFGTVPLYEFTRYTHSTREGHLPDGFSFDEWWKHFCEAFDVVLEDRAVLLPGGSGLRGIRQAEITAQLIAEPYRGDYKIRVMPAAAASHAEAA